MLEIGRALRCCAALAHRECWSAWETGLFAFKRHAGLRAMGRGRPVGRLKLLRSLGSHKFWSALRLITDQPLAATAARRASGEPAWRMNAYKITPRLRGWQNIRAAF